MHAAAAERVGDLERGEPGLIRQQRLVLDDGDGLVVEIFHDRAAIGRLAGGVGHGVDVIEAKGLRRANLPFDQHAVIGAVIAVARADLHASEHHRDGHQRQPVHRAAFQMGRTLSRLVMGAGEWWGGVME